MGSVGVEEGTPEVNAAEIQGVEANVIEHIYFRKKNKIHNVHY
jgi:hypothetical protein